MIKLDKKSFLVIGEDIQTNTKVELLSINYNHYLGRKSVDGVLTTQGYIDSVLCDESIKSVLIDLHEDNEFTDNVLIELTDKYIAKLKELNPEIKFTNTLK